MNPLARERSTRKQDKGRKGSPVKDHVNDLELHADS
jgi:hypothetical protein